MVLWLAKVMAMIGSAGMLIYAVVMYSPQNPLRMFWFFVATLIKQIERTFVAKSDG